MKDYISKYHSKQRFIFGSIILTSFVAALGVNMLLFQGTNIGAQLSADIQNSLQDNSADIHLSKNENNSIELQTNSTMSGVHYMNLSFAYNPEIMHNFQLNSEIFSIETLSEFNGIMQVLLTSETPIDLQKSEAFLTLGYDKQTDTTTSLTLIESNYTNIQGEQFLLSTPSIVF